MKLIAKLSALVCCGLTLFSCSKDSELVNPKPALTTETKNVYVTLEAGPEDASSLRLAQMVDEQGHTISPFMKEVDLNIRVAVRLNGGKNGKITVQTLRFKKDPNRLRARYTGDIRIPTAEVAGANVYEISGILLSEVDGGEVFTQIDGDATKSTIVSTIPATMLQTASDQKVDTKLPYLAQWKPLNIAGGIMEPVTLDFKPSGTLLRFKVVNHHSTSIQVKGIKVETNAFFPDWKYDFKSLTKKNLVQGERINRDKWSKTYGFSEVITLDTQGESPWQYLWVMPSSSSALATKIKVVLHDNTEVLAFESTARPMLGSVPVTLPIRSSALIKGNFGTPGHGEFPEDSSINGFPNSLLPISYIALGNVSQDGSRILENAKNDDPDMGFFSQDEAVQMFGNGKLIGSTTYYLPSQSELFGILPSFNLELKLPVEQYDVEELVTVGQRSWTAVCDYFGRGDGIIYALKFKEELGERLIAYRYEKSVGFERGNLDSHLKITCRYLGSQQPATIQAISEEQFWMQNAENDIVLKIPAAGFKNSRGVLRRNGDHIDLWTSGVPLTRPDMAFTYTMDENRYFPNNPWVKTTKLPVRLFKRQ